MKNKAGTIVHRWKLKQEQIDRKIDKDVILSKPHVLPDGTKEWRF